MDIRNTHKLKTFAAERISGAPQEKKIVLIYSGISMGLALLTTVIRFVLGLQIEQLGGLSNMSARSVLSAVQTILPLIQSLVAMCLTLGYTAAMLRIARGQYVSPNTLRLGFDRFWVLLRCSICQGMIYTGMFFGCIYVSAMIFVASPWGAAFMELLAPMMSETSLLTPEIALDDTAVMQLTPTMLPMFVILAIVAMVLILPVNYRFRMANYVIIDKPGLGALAALRESRKMMHRNCLKLLKLDLSYWWYFLIMLAISLIGSGDQWLLLLGVKLPMSADLAYFVFYAVSLALQMVVYYFLLSRVETTYALVYDSIKPEEPKDTGVVLGNIFNM